jgi:hypothetical protein
MRNKFFFTGIFFTSLFFLVTCNPADMGLASVYEDGSAWLVADYKYETNIAVPPPFSVKSYPVNPEGIGIKTAYRTSDGVGHIELAGTVLAYKDSLANGIPEGLHKIQQPDNSSAGLSMNTDFKVTTPTNTVYPSSPITIKDVLLEDAISLKSLYNYGNYTAVTIGGLVKSASMITVKETTSTVRLYTDQYKATTGSNVYIVNSDYRQVYYGKNPNFFWVEGAPSLGTSPEIPRGYGSGGLSLLLWDGASPKSSTFEISYNSGRTWNTTIVDYSGVSFEATDLKYMAWYKGNGVFPNQFSSNITVSTVTPDTPNSSGIVETFAVDVALTGPGPYYVDDFVTPSFYPISAANKRVYLKQNNLPTGAQTDSVPLTDGGTIRIADRIRIDISDTTAPIAGTDYIIYCDTYPLENVSAATTLLPIQLVMTLTYTP